MPSDIVKWSGYDIEDAEDDQAQIDSESHGFWTPAVGVNKIRFLPAVAGKKVFRKIYQHYIEVLGEKRSIRFACPRLTDKQDKPCPACEVAAKLRTSGNESDRERAFAFSASSRVYCNIIDRRNPEQGPRVYAFGKRIHEQLIAIRRDEENGGDFTDPSNGFDIIIERIGTGKLDTKYMVRPSRKVTPLNPASPTDFSWIQQQQDVEQYAKIETFEELKKRLSDVQADEDSEASGKARDVTPHGKGRRASVHDEDTDGDGD